MKCKVVGKLLLLVFAYYLTGCATGRGINEGQFNIYTYEDEKKLGEQLSQMVSKQVTFVEDPVVNAYLDRVGQKLARVAPDPLFNYQFRLIKNRQVNAFTISAGYVYVYTGLVDHAPYEAAFASVVGHEIGHNLARHVTERLSKQNLIGLASAIIGGPGGQAIDLFGGLGLLKFGRDEELEADKLGVDLAYRANFNIQGAKAIFEVFKKLEGNKGTTPLLGDLLATHPKPQDRIDRINKLIPNFKPKPSAVTDTASFRTFKTNVLKYNPPDLQKKTSSHS
ncbi:MAG: M48 family metalloprotease [Deltaproteobacteria bacterium]|nr:M48 family metalloprotease [Deltaproteobacteria bacterium]